MKSMYLHRVDYFSPETRALTRIGFTQSFGVFQAHYGREEAVRNGVLRQDEMTMRAMVSSIGSLGSGGLVAVFGIFYYPHLPQIGRHIRTLCFAGTACITLGLSAAAASHSVRDPSFFADRLLLTGDRSGYSLAVKASSSALGRAY